MSFQLRPYQRDAVQAVVRHFRKTSDPALIVLPTGAGKSLVISELGRIARGRVLVLAHVKELVEQNHGKYESYGLKASIFSAGLGRKEASEQVVFGSVQSVVRNLSSFETEGEAAKFTLLVIDECHRVSLEKDSSYHKVISQLKSQNPQLKVLGLTATPYRLGLGWLYNSYVPEGEKGKLRTEQERFFKNCVYELPLPWMVDNGYLTPPQMIDAPVAWYDFSLLPRTNLGGFREGDMNQLLKGEGRATKAIIQQVIKLSDERQGVMIFAATVEHAKEVLGYLPESESALVIGDTPGPERDQLIQRFKERELKYLVNVSVLTTGFDAPHVDVIAILRPTESVSLYQQIVGRGLRLSEGKEDCLVMDFAGNNFSIFAPEIGDPRPDSRAVPVQIDCPMCGCQNDFWGLVDSDGDLVEHYGRRCQGFMENLEGERERCSFRFRFKECGECNAENDIAARKCHECGKVLADPDDKLRAALNLRNTTVLRCSWMTMEADKNRSGEERIKVSYFDEDGLSITEFFRLETPAQQGVFYHRFGKLHQINRGEAFRARSVEDVIGQSKKFRKPDFVIALREPRGWKIREKIFDYNGAYRKAVEAG
ncbi:DEAD/DEAH box helicase [Parendozoicomonas haliclonae]|uniref:Type I restriction enzyme EcoKI subunit R n=1 Tax=Parendozoicomonas haliclonae TaxID=1960125 RepID=A0A1X7AKA4_9GAMM|nr:DEAD/DEAH box helicase [Parendozoicomonas haliclonae]SMA47561.1 type I restriction enzyme EcoKI subunit R [Parendozoicomonas haliclonae]